MIRSNEDLDASGDAGLTPNEAISFERHDHLVDRGITATRIAVGITATVHLIHALSSQSTA
jgi:hypothetical protein